ncbi:MAG: hypothetical protein IJH34_15515, partial [Romboutsia sp.]|nr:hypothetical protein [Romboutsia sp.]
DSVFKIILPINSDDTANTNILMNISIYSFPPYIYIEPTNFIFYPSSNIFHKNIKPLIEFSDT